MTGFEALAAGDPRQVGRYRVVARLGAGGMGRVFLARSPGGRPVAIKVVRAELADDPRFRQRFAREVAAARRVNGVFTAGVMDADPDADAPWLATAYVAGVSLTEAVTAHGPWAERSVRALGAGLVEALEAIHAAGVVHRDLKPSNVLVAPDGPRVIDFGISLAAEDTALTQTGSVVGTPGFMSPEQLTAAPVGPPSDVFALGAVLAYAATGTGPFGTGSAHGVNFRAVYEPPELGGLPPGLRELIGRCLEKDFVRRPTVTELLERLAVRDDAEGGPSAVRDLAATDWLPTPVARTVAERTETALPATPPPPTHHSGPGDAPGAPTAGDVAGRGVSRRGLLAGAGATAAVVAGGGLLWRLSQRDDPKGGGTADGDGATDGGATDGGATDGGANDDGAEATAGSGTVRIAFQGPITGDSTTLGVNMLAAAQLAVDDARASGDYPDTRFEIRQADDQGMAPQALAAAETAIEDARVVAVVGPVLSSMTESSAPLYAQAGLAAVTPSATNSTLTQQGYTTFLRGVPDDAQVGMAIGRFLTDQETENVMLIDDTSAYGVVVADAVHGHLTTSATGVSRESVPEGSTDPSALAGAIVDSGADALVFCGSFTQAGPLAVALAAEGYAGIRVSGDAVMNPRFLDLAGAGAEGWFVVSPGYDPRETSDGRDFADRYAAATGQAPGPFAARAYDVTMLIIETVAELGLEADRTTVYEELADARYDGLSGSIDFAANGEYTGTGPDLYQVTDGDFTPLGPAENYRD